MPGGSGRQIPATIAVPQFSKTPPSTLALLPDGGAQAVAPIHGSRRRSTDEGLAEAEIAAPSHQLPDDRFKAMTARARGPFAGLVP